MDGRPWHLYLIAAAAVAVVVLGVTQIGAPATAARTSRELVTAESGIVETTVTGTGNVQAGTDVDANFQTGGTLSQVYVHVGQHVILGQLLATLDPTAAQLTLDQAQASLASAQDQLSALQSGSAGSTTSSAATRTVTVTAPSTTPRPSSTPTTQTATTPSPSSIASAQAAVYSAEVNVQNAEQALAKTQLHAPATGTIVSLASVSPGDTVSAGSSGAAASSGAASPATSGSSSSGSGSGAGGAGGSATTSASGPAGGSSGSATPFAQIVDASTMTMTVAFSESDITKVRVGQSATVTIDAVSGLELAAHVSSISAVGASSSGVVSYDAVLDLDQTDPRVRPGMSASATVIVGQAHGVTVPNQALTANGSLGTVQVADGAKTTSQQVIVGLRGDTRTQIISGLSAGQQVVITITLPSLASAGSGTSSSNGTVGGGRFGGGAGLFGGGGFRGAGGGGGFAARGGG